MRRLLFFLLIASIALGTYFLFFEKKNEVFENSDRIVSIRISEIMSNPRYFEGKNVTVSGTVKNSFSAGVKLYSIDDGSGIIYVKTEKAVPLEGEKVRVKGKFSQFIKIGTRQYSIITEDNDSL